jgi:enamine deaminase RidA (YjgF/YER057c/UK114 family)
MKINPSSLRKPSGYTHGLCVQGGRLLFLAGQTAASLGKIDTDDFVEQFDRALAAVLDVVKEAVESRRTW